MQGQNYETNKALLAAGTEFYRKGKFKLPAQWEKCVQRNRDYVEK
jgi:hypothetical protein